MGSGKFKGKVGTSGQSYTGYLQLKIQSTEELHLFSEYIIR